MSPMLTPPVLTPPRFAPVAVPLPAAMQRGADAPRAARQPGMIVGHRGFRDESEHLPGNTLASFERGIAAGADALELDVRRLQDGTLVVHHDPQLGFRPLANMTASEVASATKGAIPTLDAVLQLARERGAGVAVELKEPGYEREVVRRVFEQIPRDRVTFMSFDDDVVRGVKAASPDARAGLLMYELPVTSRIRRAVAPRWPVNEARRAGADFLAVGEAMATERLIGDSAAAGLPVRVWTVNQPDRIAQLLADSRVEAVISDRPDHAAGIRDTITGARRAGIAPGSGQRPRIRAR